MICMTIQKNQQNLLHQNLVRTGSLCCIYQGLNIDGHECLALRYRATHSYTFIPNFKFLGPTVLAIEAVSHKLL